MYGNCIELIVPIDSELNVADKIASRIKCKTIYVNPNMVQLAGVARSLSNSVYKIFVMVDYPKGNKGSSGGMDKFKGTSTDFFLADGYDVVLTPGKNESETINEVKNIHSFVKTMISEHIDLCFTINISNREEEEIEWLAKSFYKFPPSRIKLEASPTVQPTKANLSVHKDTIKSIRKYCTTPIVVSGNVNYDIYCELSKTNKIAVSVDQFNKLEKKIKESKKEKETTNDLG